MNTLVIYDLYCSAGGVGLAIEQIADEYWPEYDVTHVGIDIEDYSDEYAGEFVQADASNPPLKPGPDLLWMSPPCQRYSSLTQVNASRYDWDDGEIEERYPGFEDLNVRSVLEELNAEDYIVENVSNCPKLVDPCKITGFGVGLPMKYERHFETSFNAPDAAKAGTSDLPPIGAGVYIKNELAEVKNVPKEWSEQEVHSAIPREYVQYLLHYCPSVPETPLPDGVDRQTLLTEVVAGD